MIIMGNTYYYRPCGSSATGYGKCAQITLLVFVQNVELSKNVLQKAKNEQKSKNEKNRLANIFNIFYNKNTIKILIKKSLTRQSEALAYVISTDTPMSIEWSYQRQLI